MCARSRASISAPCSCPMRWSSPCTRDQRHSSPTTAGHRTTSPSARGSPSGIASSPSIGNESTSVGSSTPRCSRFSARISSAETNAIPSSPASTPSAPSTSRASASAPATSTGPPLELATSISSISAAARSRSLRHAACTPPRSAARACGGRRRRGRTRRTRSRRAGRGCPAPGSAPTPARAAGRPA